MLGSELNMLRKVLAGTTVVAGFVIAAFGCMNAAVFGGVVLNQTSGLYNQESANQFAQAVLCAKAGLVLAGIGFWLFVGTPKRNR